MSDEKRVSLRWVGEGLVFRGGPPGGPRVAVDGDGRAGPSPMDQLLLSLAGCMAIDVRVILEKSRVDLESLVVDATAIRASEPPRRYLAAKLLFRVGGLHPSNEPALRRAIQLSEEKYCSVLHSLQPDLELDTDFRHV